MDQTSMYVGTSARPNLPKKGEAGHMMGTAAAQVYPHEGIQPAALAQGALVPRLLDLETAASYLSVSPWTARDLEAAGVLPRVRVPLPGGRELRKLLFDKADLDRLIGAWKQTSV